MLKKIVSSLTTLILVIIVFLTTIFAWFVIDKNMHIGEIGGDFNYDSDEENSCLAISPDSALSTNLIIYPGESRYYTLNSSVAMNNINLQLIEIIPSYEEFYNYFKDRDDLVLGEYFNNYYSLVEDEYNNELSLAYNPKANITKDMSKNDIYEAEKENRIKFLYNFVIANNDDEANKKVINYLAEFLNFTILIYTSDTSFTEYTFSLKTPFDENADEHGAIYNSSQKGYEFTLVSDVEMPTIENNTRLDLKITFKNTDTVFTEKELIENNIYTDYEVRNYNCFLVHQFKIAVKGDIIVNEG